MSSFIAIEGNPASQIEFFISEKGTPTARFTLMVNDRYKDRDQEWVSGPGVAYDVIVFRHTAENLANSDITTKDVLVVTGELTIQGWTDRDGNDRIGRRILASTVSASFARHTITTTKVERVTAANGSVGGEAEDLAASAV